MSPKQRIRTGNRILDSLPDVDQRRMAGACEPVVLVAGAVLSVHSEHLTHVYFPISGFISLIITIDGAVSLEVGLIGNEGMFGVPLALGVDVSRAHAVVQGTGSALRMDAALFSRALGRSPALQRTVNRYIFVQFNQLAQTAACTRFHVVVARLARWLLMTQDRSGGDRFHITQEWLAYMLGVRRVGVTKAAGTLQSRGLIQYRRGNIEVLDRGGLEAAACACYQADLDSYDRIFG